MSKRHKEWYSRGYLQHFDHAGVVQMVTFRLADALPADLLGELERVVSKERDVERRKEIEAWLDAGHGSCWLHDVRIATMVEEALLHFDGQRYRLLAWVIMPNHVHVLVELRAEILLSDLLHTWKSFTAKAANRMLRRSGSFWMPEYFDRYIRDEKHFANAVNYIHENPVMAHLVARAEEWPYSSAWWGRQSAARSDLGSG
jgi:REP element-mobilizing transposase RayT